MHQERASALLPSLTRGGARWIAAAVVVAVILAAGVVLDVGLVREVASAPAADGHHDFLAFHSAARLIARGTPRLMYDAGALTGLERQVIAAPVGAAGYMPYINPPFGAALQAPLGLLTEPAGRLAWLLFSVPLAAAAAWLATVGMVRNQRLLAAICLAATFPFYQAFIEGQWSFVMLLGGLVAIRALRSGQPVLAGLCLTTFALKPPLLVPLLALLLWARAWRALAATTGAVAALVVVTLPWTGWGSQVDYAGYLLGVVGSHLGGAGAAGASLWHGGMSGMEGINGLAAGYVGQQRFAIVDAVTALVLLLVLARFVQVARRRRLRFVGREGRWLAVAGIAAALLGDLHLYPQDCVLALLALPELIALTAARWRLPMVLGVAVILDLVWLDQLAFTPHLLTWALGAMFLLATRAAARDPAAAGGAHRASWRDPGPVSASG